LLVDTNYLSSHPRQKGFPAKLDARIFNQYNGSAASFVFKLSAHVNCYINISPTLFAVQETNSHIIYNKRREIAVTIKLKTGK
jgi:hypothetical protein